MNPADLRERIGGEWLRRPDGWWLQVAPERVRAAAEALVDAGARFSALVACPGEEGALRLSWHWDVAGTLLSVRARFHSGNPAPSIADICPAADWAEREATDYYAVRFHGRASTPPLVLREGDPRGILL